MKVFCPQCKQVVVKLVFSLSCGCAVLAGHAEEPFPSKWSMNSSDRQGAAYTTSTASATVSPTSFADMEKMIKGLKGPGSTSGSG